MHAILGRAAPARSAPHGRCHGWVTAHTAAWDNGTVTTPRSRATRPATAGARSRERAAQARAEVNVGPITYPEELPVSARRADIAAAVRDHQVVIVAGETGSGKTTQLPKIALELGRGRAGLIGHTQPRRIAARAVAGRVAQELGVELGNEVGFQVRFTDHSSPHTLVKVMTDGVLLAQIQHDPQLLAYDTLIIDEAHERSLNIDFLLGYLTRLLPARPDLRLIITSATIDSERFAAHFADATGTPAPIIEVTGRTYPVEVRYRPLLGETSAQDRDMLTGIVEACDELMREGPGDILVFLSGEREIRDASDALAGHLGARARDRRHPQAVELLPLFSRLSAAEQHRVFESHPTRRIVLATNVAETSLTVPGIHYVVDPGTARISRYSKATKVQRLPIEPISQASANQRAGRAGRLADGVAIRLYSREDFEGRPEFTEPEILRTSLASVLLQMIAVGVISSADDMAAFPFVEPPDTRAIRDGVMLLTELGAVRMHRGELRLTPVGRTLARLPMDPRQARMIVQAQQYGVVYEVAVIAAALSIQDPRERPAEHREAAQALHQRFADPRSDLLTYLNLWEYLRTQRKALSGSAFRRRVRAEHLNYLRIREWQDVVEQIRDAAKPLGITMPRHGPSSPTVAQGEEATTRLTHVWNEEAIHRSVLAGLLSQIGAQEATDIKASSFTHLRGEARAQAMRRARKQQANEYLGARGARFALNPGSALYRKPPGFVMAAELVETHRLWARDAAAIKPEWAEELAGDLVKRTYSEPRWSARRGAAVATEKVLLYGVPIVADRTILWGSVRPEEAREMFIRHALVEGEWHTVHRFWARNQAVRAEAEELEARSRTAGLVDDEAMVAFYEDRIPESVVSAAHFDRWWRAARRDTPTLLDLTLAELLPEDHTLDAAAFPHQWHQGDLTLALSYQFEPGTEADGLTVHVPLAVLPQVRDEGFEWLVPGLRDELLTAVVRALPKDVRRLLVPAPDAARALGAWLATHLPTWEEVTRAADPAWGLVPLVTRAARAWRDVDIPAAAWEGWRDRLPAHLRVTFRVEDAAGRMVREGGDLAWLQRELAPDAQRAVASALGASGGTRAAPAPRAATHPERAPRTHGSPAVTGTPLATWPVAVWEQPLVDGALPHSIETRHGVAGHQTVVRGYPGIVDAGGRAELRLLTSAAERDALAAAGVRRLLLTELALPTKRVTTRWNATQALALGASPYRSTDALVLDLHWAAVTALTPTAHTVRTAAAYTAVRDAVRQGLEDEVHRLAGVATEILTQARELDADVRRANSLALLGVVTEIRTQAAALAGEGFVGTTPPERLPHVTRYLKALRRRLDTVGTAMARDTQNAWQVAEVVKEYEAVRAAVLAEPVDAGRRAAIEDVRWQIEELRVSLFAQELGTQGSISPQRIRKALAALRTA